MASLSAKAAATQVGMTKAGLLKAVRNGKVSAQKDHNGEWQIDPAELFRVYPPVNRNVGDEHPQVDDGTQDRTQAFIAEIEGLRELVEAERRRGDDLARRLDQEGQERRQLQAVLMDAREKKRGLWARLFG